MLGQTIAAQLDLPCVLFWRNRDDTVNELVVLDEKISMELLENYEFAHLDKTIRDYEVAKACLDRIARIQTTAVDNRHIYTVHFNNFQDVMRGETQFVHHNQVFNLEFEMPDDYSFFLNTCSLLHNAATYSGDV